MKSLNNKGITLIALIITVLVLMILTGVAIAAITGDDGIISRTTTAKDDYNAKVSEEEGVLGELKDKMNDNMGSESGGSTSVGGLVTEVPTLPSGWNSSKVTPIYGTTSKDYVAPVPKDFYYVGGTKSTGIVISDNAADKNKGDSHEVAQTLQGNQFVWIPIDDIGEIYDANNNAGKKYNFTSGGNSTVSGIFEIRYVTGDWPGAVYLDSDPANLQEAGSSATTKEQFKTELQNEFNRMISSVAKYKGYYVGRYETGNLSQSKVVVKANNTDIQKGWYTKYRLQKDIYADKSSVHTGMIWGCQWHGLLRFINTNYSLYGNFVTNIDQSRGSHMSMVPTGSNGMYKVNNMYDISGNVSESSVELGHSESRGSFGEMYELPYELRGTEGQGGRITMYIAE